MMGKTLELSLVQETVAQVAEAITSALEIDTEIVDAHLKIISGTGRLRKKIGTYEEGGDLVSDEYYAEILRTGEEKICLDTKADSQYHPVEGELSEITCPIRVDDNVVGLIGLIAFTEEQHNVICGRTRILTEYLRKMAELLASKLVESQSNYEFNVLLDSAPQGMIATRTDGTIIFCNEEGESLVGESRDRLKGTDIKYLFPQEELFSEKQYGSVVNREVIYKNSRLFFDAVIIPDVGNLYFFHDSDTAAELIQTSIIDSGITFDDIYGTSSAIMEAKKLAFSIANNDSNVFITGESGTGKELFARAIHNTGRRRGKPFISINCGAIPESLFESELFGYERGAFTGANAGGKVGKFELANQGTIFLDEIGDMPIHMQVKLLRVLQDREIQRVGGTTSKKVDVRVIAATNKHIEKMVKNNEFRSDLYFRLCVIPLHLPPLRDRKEDLLMILNRALNRFNGIMNKRIEGFEPEAMDILINYSWPGNIREVENVIEYCVNMEEGRTISVYNLPEKILNYGEKNTGTDNPLMVEGEELSQMSLKEQMSFAERRILERTLRQTGWDRKGKQMAAEKLGIGESSLYRKIKELGIE